MLYDHTLEHDSIKEDVFNSQDGEEKMIEIRLSREMTKNALKISAKTKREKWTNRLGDFGQSKKGKEFGKETQIAQREKYLSCTKT